MFNFVILDNYTFIYVECSFELYNPLKKTNILKILDQKKKIRYLLITYKTVPIVFYPQRKTILVETGVHRAYLLNITENEIFL